MRGELGFVRECQFNEGTVVICGWCLYCGNNEGRVGFSSRMSVE